MAYVATWTEIPNTRLTDAYPSYILNAPQGYKIGSPFGSESGGCHDPIRRWFYSPVPGGHTDWYFNFVVGVHIPTNLVSPGWVVLSDASRFLPEFAGGPNGGEFPLTTGFPAIGPPIVYSDGRPVARHTYGSVQCSPTNNELWVFSGPKWYSADQDTTVHRFRLGAGPNQYTWTTGAPGFHAPFPGFMTEYDIRTNTTWGRDRSHLVGYNHTLQSWFRHSKSVGSINDRCTSVLDPVRDRFLLHRMSASSGLGDTYARMASIDSEADQQVFVQFDLSGDYSVFNEQSPGWVYLSGIDKYVAWAGLGTGGADVTIMDPVTGFCTVITGTGATLPGTDAAHGSYGRFAAFGPNEIILANKVGDNMWQLVITDDADPGTSVDLVMQHAAYTPPVATSVARYDYTVVGVETQSFQDEQSRVTFTGILDGTYTPTAGAYDGLGALIGALTTGNDFTIPFPAGSVDVPEVHSVVVGGTAFVSVTVPVATNLAMIVFVSGRFSNNVVSVTFDGEALTEIDFVGSGAVDDINGRFIGAYVMLNPPVKTATVSAARSLGSSTSVVESVVFVHTVNQTTPFGAAVAVANAAGSAASTVMVPSAVNDLVMTALTTGSGGHVPGAGQTAVFVNAASSQLLSVRQGVSTLPGLVTETEMPWTFTNASGIYTAQIGFAIKGAGAPAPPNEDPVDRVVATGIAVVVGATLEIDVTYTTESYPFDTEEVTLWQVHLVDVNGAVVGPFHESIAQTAVVQERDLPLPDGFGTPYRVRARERNAETGTIVNEFFSATVPVVPAAGPVSILVPTAVTYTPIPVEGGPDGLRVSWTMGLVEFGEEIDVASYTAVRVNVGALPPKILPPTVTEWVFPRVLPGPYPIQVGRYRMETDEFLQFVGISVRHGNREVSL